MRTVLTQKQYEITQKVINSLKRKFHNLSEVEVEIAVYDAVEYVLATYGDSHFRNSLYWKASRILYTTYNHGKTLRDNFLLQSYSEEQYEEDAGQITEREEFYKRVMQCIIDMSNVEQNVLYMYLVGYSVYATANILGISRGRVKTIRENVFNKLREEVKDYAVY